MNLKSHTGRVTVGFEGRHRWAAEVACTSPTGEKAVQRVQIFADDRSNAAYAACELVKNHGYHDCTLNHITKV